MKGPSGVLVVDKPKGLTSFDVVREVRRALSVKKAGHTGTLDPMATGVLPVCVGEATKVAQFILEATKSYEARLRLGVCTDTLDADGRVVSERPVPLVDAASIEQILNRFRGAFEQTPPMYSAIKVGGRRLYEMARAGEEVERVPRSVTVFELALRDFSATEMALSIRCSKGFFVRSLAHDIGEALGCGAHLMALRRTQSGPFSLTQALALSEVQRRGQDCVSNVLPISEALRDLPVLSVSRPEADRVRHGGLVEVPKALRGVVQVVGPDGEVLALAEVEGGRLRYRRVLAISEE